VAHPRPSRRRSAVHHRDSVLGLRLNNTKTPTKTPQASATPPATSSTPANAVYATSGIGVTGWWTGPSSFTIRLVYQGTDGYLRLMRYHSGDGNWSTLATFSDANAKLGSPIAASSYSIPFYCFSPITSSNVRETPFLFPYNFTPPCMLTNTESLELHTSRNLLPQQRQHTPRVVFPRTRPFSTGLFRQRPHVPQRMESLAKHAFSQHTGPASSSKTTATRSKKRTTLISPGRGAARASRAETARLWQRCLLLSSRGDSEAIRFSISGMTRSSSSRGKPT
jgi:hypothetical protein